MASSSSSHQQKQEFNAFSGIVPASKRRKVCESSRLYDVFINHRGPDVKQTLATQLYNSLKQLGIQAFLDSEEKELGNSFPSTIETAISSASVHIAIFSKRYAESAWCLIELVLMLKSEAKIIPVFYQVKPSDLRYIETGVYAEAFIRYEKKGRYLEKLNEWKEALQSLSLIAGEEFNSDWDCQNIVSAVQKEVQRKTHLHVAEYPVGLNNLVEDFERRCLDELVQDFENQCGLEDEKHKVAGIFGMGGSGKTTLAKELFNRKRQDYVRSSFLFNVREASVRSQLPSLQGKLLNDLFDNQHLSFTSIEEGASYLRDRLQRSPLLSCLIVVDDIDHVDQLKALPVIDTLNKSDKSLVIVTTRDVGVLTTVGIAVRYNLKEMNRYSGRELFSWHAFGQPHPCSGYEDLVEDFVDVCGGLPLSLQVLGRHVHGRDRSYWRLELAKANQTLPRDVMQRLRISFDALEAEEKQVFMDLACFFLGEPRSVLKRVWEGSGWNFQHALETLKDKCLVEEIYIQGKLVLRMHDHLGDLGREMALELSPPRRLWRSQDLECLKSTGFREILTKTNIRCFHSIFDESMECRVKFFLGQSDMCFETSASLLWLLVEGNSTKQPRFPFPSGIPLQNLQCLKIRNGRVKKLWENGMQAPSHLKKLAIFQTVFEEIPDFAELVSGLRMLEQLKIIGCPELQELRVAHLTCLDKVTIINCNHLKSVSGICYLENLVKLTIVNCGNLKFEYLCLSGMKYLEDITFDRTIEVKSFKLDGCQNLKYVNFGCEELVELRVLGCSELCSLPDFIGPSCLQEIIIDGCQKLKSLVVHNCQILKSVSGNLELTLLSVKWCPELERLPSFARLSYFESITIDSCEKLHNISGIEELHASEKMILCYCSNAVIRNCIHNLKSVLLNGTIVIGRAVDGAESTLNEYLFLDAGIGAPADTEIGRPVDGSESTLNEYPFSDFDIGAAALADIVRQYNGYVDIVDDECLRWEVLSAVVGCYVVVVDNSTSVEDINQSLFSCSQGEWIITVVACDSYSYHHILMRIENILRGFGIMKMGVQIEVKKGEELKGLGVLRIIVNRLHS